MSGIRRESRVADSFSGWRINEYLADRFTYYGTAEWERHVDDGRVELNGERCLNNSTLKKGDRIAFSFPEIREPEVPSDYRILFEDDLFLFVDKPAGLPCHPSGIYRTRTLWNFLQPRYGALHLINRLDRETSGVVAAAKTGESAARAAQAMQEGLWTKEYRVAVEGRIKDNLDARGFLIRDTASPIRKKLTYIPVHTPEPLPEGALPVHTKFFPAAHTEELTDIRAELYTGKTHQIRATLQALGYPVVGDKLYGRDPTVFLRFIEGSVTEEDRVLLRMNRQALHCGRIAFRLDPGTEYEVTAPIPTDWPIRQ